MLSFSQTISKTLILVVATILLIRHSAEIQAAQLHQVGIITVGRLHLRTGPSQDHPSLKILRKGTKIQFLEQIDGWLKISYKGQIGYIRNLKQYVHIMGIVISTDKQLKADQVNDIKRIRKKAENISLKIKKGETEVQMFTKKESNIINNLNHIDLALNTARKKASESNTDLIALEKQISETTAASKDMVKKIEENEVYAAKRLVSLYKMNWLGRLNVLASSESLFNLFQRKKNLELILSHDQNTRKNLLKNKLELQILLVRLNTQKKEKLSLEDDLEDQIQLMAAKRAQRANLLDDIRSKKTMEMAAIESLKQAASDLNIIIKALSSAAIPSDRIKKKSPKDFTSLKGLLNMPVMGKIVDYFGPYKNSKFNVVNFRSGIVIQADRGEPIRAVFGGKIIYAGWLKGYGNMIIADHGDNYYTVYAHAEELFASKDNIVEKGEVVATVGDTGSLIGPSLHFEVRHHGKPVDPLAWLKKG
jgi:septal ring factor EnvC (AmiA/AmiB activator)